MKLELLPGGLKPRQEPRIVLHALEPELVVTFSHWIRECWPRAEIRLSEVSEASAVALGSSGDIDLSIHCGPRPPTHQDSDGPCVLWLGEMDRTRAPSRLGPALWHSPMPTSAEHLRHAIALCLRARAG